MRILFALAGLACCLGAANATAAPANLRTNHPLNGTLWDTRSGEPVTEATLFAEAAVADWVLLGEKHDNAEHHRLQARVVGALGRAGRRVAVVWEMAQPAQAEVLRAARLETVDDLGRALDWEERGWPDWADYQPIAEQALTYDFPMLPGKPPHDLVRSLGKGGDLPEAMAAKLRWSRVYSPEVAAELKEELEVSHCGALPSAAVNAMAEVQRFWDAWIAASLRDAKAMSGSAADGAVLIAGSGHVRRDRAVPWHLEGQSLTLAFVEVVEGRETATDYPSFDPQLFDYVWFTPRVDENDPCEAFAKKPAQ